jgi:hypothetical protein
MKLTKLMMALLGLLFTTNIIAQDQTEQEVLKYSMSSKWTNEVNTGQPWDLYPRPQMRRAEWTNLNGSWEYAITDQSEELPKQYDGKILVPFAVESALSGVKKLVGPEKHLWYRTSFSLPSPATDEIWQLHFGAVDWEATIYVNGQIVGGHKGGYTPFSFNISPYLKKKGKQELIVRVWDPTDAGTQARGKQVRDPRGIWYTPVTGIWQTVWLEKTPADHIRSIRTMPDIDRNRLGVELKTSDLSQAVKASLSIRAAGREVAKTEVSLPAGSQAEGLEIALPTPRLWSPEDPFLYDLNVELYTASGQLIDQVESYFGMRKISLGKDPNGYTRIMLNNQPVFQFGLLDQGWWPDGLYTAPTEEALMYDVEMTRDFGFNMLRKHVKVEPARYYYNCDRMGMLVWQDMPNGNYFNELRVAPESKQDAERPLSSALQFEGELKEMIDYFHAFPSIVTWVPFNEGWGQYDTERIAGWVKNYDPSRLCIAPSGWADRGVGDIIDVHIYPGPGMEAPEKDRASVLGEFGGLGYPVPDHMWWDKRNWGYLTFQDQATLESRFTDLINDLVGLKSCGLSAAVYTQTTDVEGEVNGMMTYDRQVIKIAPEITRSLFAPLYRSAWNKRTLLEDAESEAQSWYISREGPAADWQKPEFDATAWHSATVPLSSFDNPFLPTATQWGPEETLYLRRSFYLNENYENINLKYYLHQAEIDVFINGKEVTHLQHEGGRKRHYTNKLIDGANAFLRKGRNVIAVRLKRQAEECTFDLGIYSAALVENAKQTSTDQNENNKTGGR